MKKTLNECIELYKYYSVRIADAICSHEDNLITQYTNEIFELVDYTSFTYDVYLYDMDLSDIL